MKKYINMFGVLALALAMSGLPAGVLAESNGGEGSADTQVRVQALGTDISASGSARVGESEDEEKKVEEQGDRPKVANSDQKDKDESVGEDQDEQDDIELGLEDDEDVASSLDDLKQKIEERKQELDDEEASTTPKFRNAVKNANEVRLAVHALLASKDLLGGIGEQVSEIAKQMNDSVASTTNAEAQIEARGFLVKFFFGGDKKAAKVISKETERNQKSIEKLTELLNQANLSVDFQTALKAQITALEEAQARFQILAQKEQKMWGIFSWRF